METVRKIRRAVVTFFGFVVVVLGVVLLILPGPGIIVILIGLGILSLEFDWARKIVIKIRSLIERKPKE